MSDRLRHLQRQQALLREHLAWIDGEIAKETGATAFVTTTTPPTQANLTSPPPLAATPDTSSPTTTTSDADVILERYAASERQNPADLRRGCLIVFATALFLVAGGVAAIWLIYY